MSKKEIVAGVETLGIEEVRQLLQASGGLARKTAIGEVADEFRRAFRHPDWPRALGDDASPVPTDDGYLLLAADGIWRALLSDPYWAGYCSVLVNVNDISAMGGLPLAMVNVLVGGDQERRRRMVQGIAFASRHFRVPMVGGHLHPEGLEDSVSVAILGRATSLVDSFSARPGDLLFLVADLEGDWHHPFPHWDSTTHRSPDEIQAHLSVLPALAQEGHVSAGKDISNPGILGTLLMLMETSRVGALIRLEDIPRPPGVPLREWLGAYPGLGYVLAVPPPSAYDAQRAFSAVGLAAAVIGQVCAGSALRIVTPYGYGQVWDWEAEPVTGIGGESR